MTTPLQTMPIPKSSEATIRQHTTTQSFHRGEDYYRSGAVVALTQRGNILASEVEGSEAQLYRVTLSFDSEGFTSAHCTCAYCFEGWCKHIVATMLVCLHQSQTIEERPTLEQLLNRLDLVQTQGLLQNLVAENPRLIEAIDRHISLIVTPAPEKQSPKPVCRTTVDPAPFRREVRQILRDAVRYLEDGCEDDPITENLLEVVQQAQVLSEQGDGNNALVILEAITAACVDNWEDVADYGAESNEVVEGLNEAWTEAILSADLTPEEKVDLRVNLEAWQDELSGNFAMSLEALRQGWDNPPLQRVLQGNITELGAWEGDPPTYADDLVLIRLKILDLQERYQEYLYLAQAAGQTQQYLTMLGRLGRVEEAMGAATTQMTSMKEAFALAQTLREQGALEQALQIAQMGLSLPEQPQYQYDLATWTSDLAEGLGDRQVALSARIAAFKAKPDFGDYLIIEELAGAVWSTVKPDLLKTLRAHEGWGMREAKVNIFLYEGLIDDAIASISGLSSYDSALIYRVMDAAIEHRPDWVIENACLRAESIMDRGKAEHYDEAVTWLKKVCAAYLQAGQKSEWSTYKAKLMQTHARKYKLMTLFKQLS